MTSPIQGSGQGASTSQYYTYTADGQRVVKPGVDPVLLRNLELLARQAEEWGSSSSVEGMPEPNMAALADAEGADLSGLSADVSTDILNFLALFRDFAQKRRETAQQMAGAAMRASVDQLLSAADQMRKSGVLNFDASKAEAIHQIGAGATQTTTAAISMGVTGYGLNQSRNAAENRAQAERDQKSLANNANPNSRLSAAAIQKRIQDLTAAAAKNQHNADAATTTAGSLNQASAGLSQIIEGAGKLAAAKKRLEAAYADAKRSEDEAASQGLQHEAQTEKDIIETTAQWLRDLNGTYQEKIRTDKAIADTSLKA